MKAQSLNDLVIQSDVRQLLWQSLRESATQGQTYHVDLPEADIPPEVLGALLGIKELEAPYAPKVPEAPKGTKEGGW